MVGDEGRVSWEAWMTGGRNRRDETHSAMTMYCMALSSVALAATPGAAAAAAGAGASFFAVFFFFGGIPLHGVWGRPARPDTAPNSGFRPIREGTRAELVSPDDDDRTRGCFPRTGLPHPTRHEMGSLLYDSTV